MRCVGDDDDGKLYVAIGQPHNVPLADKVALDSDLGIGGIVRMDAFTGAGREVYSRGIRNSVGMDFNPKDKSLWWTDNQTDGLGNEIPPGELNRPQGGRALWLPLTRTASLRWREPPQR